MEQDAWGGSPLDFSIESSPIDEHDGTGSVHTNFPVRRNSQDPKLLTILPLLDRRNPKHSQRPTGGSSASTSQVDPTVETSSQWHESAREPIEISAVEEEGVEQFVDTPWTIARRLAQHPKKHKYGHQDFGPEFALKLPPTNDEEETIQLPSTDNPPVEFGSPVKQTLSKAQSDSRNSKAWFNHPHHGRKKFITPEINNSCDSFPSFDPHSSGGARSSLSHSDLKDRRNSVIPSRRIAPAGQRDNSFPRNAQISLSETMPHQTIQSQQINSQRSPDWSLAYQVDENGRPANHSENITEYTGIQNTTSAIGSLPHLTSSTMEVERGLDDHDTLDHYYRSNGFEENNEFEDNSYGDEHLGLEHQVHYQPEYSDVFPQEGFEIDDYSTHGLVEHVVPDQSTLLSNPFWNQETWEDNDPYYQLEARQDDDVDQENFDWDSRLESYNQTNFDQVSNCPPDLYHPSRAEFSQQKPSAKVGRLSGYNRKRTAGFPRAPAYARGSTSSRTPAEVYHFKGDHQSDGKNKNNRNRKSFREQVKEFKYQRSNEGIMKKSTPPIARGAKLTALYEPSSSIRDHKKLGPTNEIGVDLQLPSIRSRAIKPTPCSSSAGISEEPSRFDSSRKHLFKPHHNNELHDSTSIKKEGFHIPSAEKGQESFLKKPRIVTVFKNPDPTRNSDSDDDVTIISPSPKNDNHMRPPLQFNTNQRSIKKAEDHRSESESDDIEIIQKPKELQAKNEVQKTRKFERKENKRIKNLEAGLFSNHPYQSEERESRNSKNQDIYNPWTIEEEEEDKRQEESKVYENIISDEDTHDSVVNFKEEIIKPNIKKHDDDGMILDCESLKNLSFSKFRKVNQSLETQVSTKRIWSM